ncbi:MAG: hypothetical protein ABS49_10515 [Erythrobacter sp. SCN 62-14]|nr:MAG: hypothetical protein ABS49_10515 [Erythrobacter sp. SCN 62-14]
MQPDMLALAALGWLLGEPARAQRYLDLTGLDPDGLRRSLDNHAVLASALDFLSGHEPDLVAAAEALAVTPEDLIQAAKELTR